MEYAHIDAFMKDPAKIWQVLIRDMKDVLDKARPNSAHRGLARLELLGILKTIITQNVDVLHQMAGSTDVIEFHGNFAWQRCMQCNHRMETRRIELTRMPPRCECGGIFRPECVFFGEMISPDDLIRSRQAASNCDIMLVVGTSALVQPAAYMPVIAKRSGARIIEINSERTPLSRDVSDLFITGKAGDVFNRLLTEIGKLRGEEG